MPYAEFMRKTSIGRFCIGQLIMVMTQDWFSARAMMAQCMGHFFIEIAGGLR